MIVNFEKLTLHRKIMDIVRLYDQNRARHDDKFIVRDDIQICCELRYKWAHAMMKARGSYD